MFTFFTLLNYLLFNGVSGIPVKYDKCKLDKTREPQALVINNDINSISDKRINYYTLIIDVRFVVFHDGEDGRVSGETLQKQIDVLNEAFAGKYADNMMDTKIRFRLDTTKYVDNRGYYTRCDSIDGKLMKRFSRKTEKIMNIMVCTSNLYLGWAYYPWVFNEDNRMNTIFINSESLPAGGMELYNKGFTLVHEIGHYFGLIHTFSYDGICIDGDMITDTPTEMTPNFWCDKTRDSCPGLPGKDPIENYMDYSPDDCMNEFTFLQINRIWDIIDKYKPTLKRWSRDNFLRDYQEKTTFINKGKGLCISKTKGKLETYRYLKKKFKFVYKTECESKTKEYIGQAYTFTEQKYYKNILKYNCLIHKVNTINELDEIEPSETIDKGKYKTSDCYSLKKIE